MWGFERWRNKNKIEGGKSATLFTYLNSVFSWDNKIDEFCPEKAYELSLQLAEVFIPIDAIASRVAALEYVVMDENGEEVKLSPKMRALLKQPNALSLRFSDLIYPVVFSELSDGNSYVYRKQSLDVNNPEYISGIWCLPPNIVSIHYKREVPDFFSITNKSDLVDHYKILNSKTRIEPNSIIHSTSTFFKDCGLSIKGRSPLEAAEKNINNLLAVYEARNKVYKNNGMAGILSKAHTSSGGSIEAAMNPGTLKEIQQDLNSDFGITGNKNIWAASSIPLTFIKTLATISELQPFEETEADAIVIAGILGLDKELIPKRGSTTFTNKKDAEIALWQNTIKPMSEDVCRILDEAFLLPEDQHFVAKTNHIEVLQEDKNTKLESDKLIIENIKAIEESGLKDNPAIKRILEGYEQD